MMAVANNFHPLKVMNDLIDHGWHLELMPSNYNVQSVSKWCHDTIGSFYNDMIMAGDWYGAEMPANATRALGFDSLYYFAFNNDQARLMFKLRWP